MVGSLGPGDGGRGLGLQVIGVDLATPCSEVHINVLATPAVASGLVGIGGSRCFRQLHTTGTSTPLAHIPIHYGIEHAM